MNLASTIQGFDFHCHVDLHPDPPSLIQLCADMGIGVLAVTTTPKAWKQNRVWARRWQYAFPAVGLHPELVQERYSEIQELENCIAESPFVGEVGLDGSTRHRKSYKQQRDVFVRVLTAAQKCGRRVLSIHSRHAAQDTISLIRDHTNPKQVLSIMHWFGGTSEDARAAVEAGCFFSVNYEMLSHGRFRQLLASIPVGRLLTETDAPYSSVGRLKSTPPDVLKTADLLSQYCGLAGNAMKRHLVESSLGVLTFARVQPP
jgi:TatD DNase family protein